MRYLLVTSAAAAIWSAVLLVPPHAGAMTLGSAHAIRSAVDHAGSIETVACYGFGWRGWGVYPGWYPACNRGAPVYVAPGYVPVAPGYAAPAYPAPRRCWVQADPGGNSGYWTTC